MEKRTNRQKITSIVKQISGVQVEMYLVTYGEVC